MSEPDLHRLDPESVAGLDGELAELWQSLRRLHAALRAQTWERYGRANPFVEDLFEWKEKGAFVGGRNVTIYDSTTVIGDVTIGDDTWIGPFCSIDGTGGLRIGHHCSIATGCHINTHDTLRWALSGGAAAYEYASVEIGDCCFLGVGTVVNRGVTIGEHSLIGAGAVVTADVPAYSIALGVPATVAGTVHVNGASVELRFAKRPSAPDTR